MHVTTVHKIAEQVQRGRKDKEIQSQKREAVVKAMAEMDPEKKLAISIDKRIHEKSLARNVSNRKVTT